MLCRFALGGQLKRLKTAWDRCGLEETGAAGASKPRNPALRASYGSGTRLPALLGPGWVPSERIFPEGLLQPASRRCIPQSALSP